jgi:hypothetical protein
MNRRSPHAAGAEKSSSLPLRSSTRRMRTPLFRKELAQALGQDLVVELVVFLEDLGVGQKVHLGAALVGVAGDAHGRDFDAVHRLDQAVLHKAAANSISCFLPSRRTVRRSLDSAFTQDTPTPCRPPETL